MARYRLVHVGAAALLAAAGVTTFSLAQSVLARPASSGSAFVPTPPCRLVDTRAGSAVGTRTTPLGAGETATFAVTGTNGECTIPLGATAIATNVTIDNPSNSSYLAVFPADAAETSSSSLNWQAHSAPVANQATVGLSATGAINVFNYAGSVDVIIDVTGYYEPTQAPQADTLGGLQCTTGQTVTWDGSAWQCADPVVDTDTDTDTDTLASLNCTINQSIRWDGSAWQCQNQPITAMLARASFDNPCCDITEFFPQRSPNVDTSWPGPCFDGYCDIHLIDVTDHTTCQVFLSGYNYAQDATISTYTDHIEIYFYGYSPADPMYVSITCIA